MMISTICSQTMKGFSQMTKEKEVVDLTPVDRDYKKDFEMYRSYVGSCITNKTSSIDTFTEFANPEIE